MKKGSNTIFFGLAGIGGAGGGRASSASTRAAAGVETLQLADSVQFAMAQTWLFGDFSEFEIRCVTLTSFERTQSDMSINTLF